VWVGGKRDATMQPVQETTMSPIDVAAARSPQRSDAMVGRSHMDQAPLSLESLTQGPEPFSCWFSRISYNSYASPRRSKALSSALRIRPAEVRRPLAKESSKST